MDVQKNLIQTVPDTVWRSHLRNLGRNRVLITDVLGLRYQIPDAKALDGASRRILERYL